MNPFFKTIVLTCVNPLCFSSSILLLKLTRTKNSEIPSGDGSLMAGYPLATSGATSYSNYLQHYYDNLTHNFGMNYDSSCGYVALAMLFSYYDNYFDSNLVPSSYDVVSSDTSYNLINRRNSPGVLHDDFETTNFSNIYSDYPGSNLYLSYCYLISSTSLHAKLITIASQLGYTNSGSYYGGFTSFLSHRIGVTNYYLQNVVNLSSSDYTIISGSYDYTYYVPTYDTMVSNICNLIDAGFPVLLGIGKTQYGSVGHAVIAYDYLHDSRYFNSVTFYCHPGVSHEGYSTHMTISEMGYSFIQNYMAISFDYEGIPDDNYVVVDNNVSTSYQYNSNQLNWQTT